MFAIQGNVWKSVTDKLCSTLKILLKNEYSAGHTLKLAKCSLWVEFSVLLVSMYKVSLEHSQIILCIVCGCFQTIELSGWL